VPEYPVSRKRRRRVRPGRLRAVIAGGGTGGHLFPGIAIASELGKRHPGARFLFVTGRRKIESEILNRLGYEQMTIDVEGIKGRGWMGAFQGLLRLPHSFFQSCALLRAFVPQMVVGVGGYSSGPVCVAARLMGIPTAIHEQNSFPGLTNRVLCRIVDRVFVSFEQSLENFAGGTLSLTGNPVREELLGVRGSREKPDRPLSVLVMGGSQGARAVNKAFAEAMSILKGQGRKIDVMHQTGQIDYQRCLQDYMERSLDVDPVPFIHDMAVAYGWAHMVVSRAGATTVSELCALGKPSILIPYPHAANRHQEVNALMVARSGGAVILRERDLDGQRLANLLIRYMEDRQSLELMGLAARKMGRPEAARLIADQLEGMLG
jgi:UDP-N-acetylglucosamine--N-acetylmuramyl-(pentapeptide) pyrophosphoryl-undecaprenol N-acetylglucosamine transferase